MLATVLDNFTYWECKGGRDKESAQKCFLIFFYLVEVTQVTQETFTEDPSKHPFLCFHTGDRRIDDDVYTKNNED